MANHISQTRDFIVPVANLSKPGFPLERFLELVFGPILGSEIEVDIHDPGECTLAEICREDEPLGSVHYLGRHPADTAWYRFSVVDKTANGNFLAAVRKIVSNHSLMELPFPNSGQLAVNTARVFFFGPKGENMGGAANRLAQALMKVWGARLYIPPDFDRPGEARLCLEGDVVAAIFCPNECSPDGLVVVDRRRQKDLVDLALDKLVVGGVLAEWSLFPRP